MQIFAANDRIGSLSAVLSTASGTSTSTDTMRSCGSADKFQTANMKQKSQKSHFTLKEQMRSEDSTTLIRTFGPMPKLSSAITFCRGSTNAAEASIFVRFERRWNATQTARSSGQASLNRTSTNSLDFAPAINIDSRHLHSPLKIFTGVYGSIDTESGTTFRSITGKPTSKPAHADRGVQVIHESTSLRSGSELWRRKAFYFLLPTNSMGAMKSLLDDVENLDREFKRIKRLYEIAHRNPEEMEEVYPESEQD
jgi:hypothetical protein